MPNRNLKFIVFGLACVLAVVVAYELGQRQGQDKAMGLSKGAFVTSLNALQKLDAGKNADAIRVLEGYCYFNSMVLLSDRESMRNSTVKNLLPELVQYRKSHLSAAPPSYVESKLDSLLAALQVK